MAVILLTKNKNIVLAGIIIVVCTGALFLLLAESSVPIFSVKELMDYSQPESYINRKIQLVGVVKESNGTHFSVNDPEDVYNDSLIIFVEAINVEKPVGFVIGKTVLIEGKLLSTGDNWKFKASMISTKCPSKYESDD
jgi:cytochrome c-type biogenesis protein CcmE